MSEERSGQQHYGQAQAPWGRAKSEPKFRDVGGGMIESIRTSQLLIQGPLGRWRPVSKRVVRERAAE